MKSSLITALLCVLTVATVVQAQTFSAFEVIKADKIIQLNGAYPVESNRIDYRCLIDGCGSKVYFILPAEYEQNLVKISFGKDKTDIDCYSHTEKTYQHVLYRKYLEWRKIPSI